MAGAALGAVQAPFAWQAQHLEHFRLLLRGRRSTWSTYIEVGGNLSTSDANGRRLVLRGKGSTRSIAVRFAWQAQQLEQFRLLFAWQAQHFEHLHSRRKSGDEWCEWAPPRFAWQAQHLEHFRLVLRGRRSTWSTSGSFCVAEVRRRVLRIANRSCLVLRGRRSTWNTSGSFCVAGAALGAPCTQHHLQYIIGHTIYTTPSPQPHQHNLINTTPSKQHHPHTTIYTTSSTAHHHQHSTISTTSSTQPRKHNLIDTSPSTQHHQHNTINTTPSTLHHQTHHHEHNLIHTSTSSSTHNHLHSTIYTTPSTLLNQHNTMYTTSSNTTSSTTHSTSPSTTHHQQHIINTSPSSTQHHQHNIINTSPSTQHHQHNTINTTPSTAHHQHNTINTTSATPYHQHNLINTSPSTQHHPHNTIYTISSNIGRCSNLTPSASFLLIPLVVFLCLDCSLFLFCWFHSWMSEDVVNIWGYPVLYFFSHATKHMLVETACWTWGRTCFEIEQLNFKKCRIIMSPSAYELHSSYTLRPLPELVLSIGGRGFAAAL